MQEVQARAWRSLQRIGARHHSGQESGQDVTVAVVTHGDIVRALLMLTLGMPIDHIHRLEAVPGSVSELLLDNGKPLVRGVNLTF